MPTRRSLPLMLLLLAVAAGLFTMHTVGHSGPDTRHLAMGHDGTGAAARPALVEHAVMAPADGVHIGAGGPHQVPLDPIAVCLAVLYALTVIVAVVVLSGRLRHAPDLLTRRVLMVLAAVRAPPYTGVGLRLADLSVLRT